jgi:hypothetical protein
MKGTTMTAKEIVLKHLKKSSDHHAAMAETEQKLSKVHGDAAESHTNAVLAQHHRDLSDHHRAKAQHHTDRAKHFLSMHEHVSGVEGELFDSHSDAGDELRSAAGRDGLLKRMGAIAD